MDYEMDIEPAGPQITVREVGSSRLVYNILKILTAHRQSRTVSTLNYPTST